MAARLSKDELRVLCAMVDCGTELATILESGVWTKGGWQRAVWFPPGWSVRPDGVWHQPRTKQRRLPGAGYKGVTGWLPLNLPLEAACPTCEQRQTLEPQLLRVDPNKGDPVPGHTPAIPRLLG